MTSAGRKRHEVLPLGTSAGETDRSSALQILYRARQRELVQPWRFNARYCHCAGVAWLIYSNSQAVPPSPGGEPAITLCLVERNRGRRSPRAELNLLETQIKEDVMAKGQQRGNREAKKPKKEKPKVIAAAPSRKIGTWQPDILADRKK